MCKAGAGEGKVVCLFVFFKDNLFYSFKCITYAYSKVNQKIKEVD